MSRSPRVLIVSDGETPHVLPAVRSLARAGYDVGLATPGGASRRWTSRYARRTHDVPTVQSGLASYLDAVARAITEAGYDVVLPGDDADLLALSWGRDRLAALLPYAGHEVVVRAIDKLELTSAAQAAGIATPATAIADDETVAAARLPLVVKARLHWSPDAPADDRHLLAVDCASRDEVIDAVAAMRAAHGNPLLQQRIDGRLMAVSVVVGQDGRLLAVSQQESQRLSLRRTSVLAMTVEPDAELVERVRVLLTGLGWHGLANLQFLRADGAAPALIDLNGRFYGSLALAIRAGADLPAIWLRDALGERQDTTLVARAGVRFQALEEDLRRARAHPEGGLVRDVARVLAAAPGSVHTSWARDDPRPALLRAGRMLATAMRRVAPAVRSSDATRFE